jgi:DNA-binding NarL/FixJ family response regulator
MPQTNGRELVERIRAVVPSLRCLFMSVYTANIIAENGVLDEGLWFIQKPFSMRAFGAKVGDAQA